MGYIPIVIALLAFLILLMLVNVSSIQNSQRVVGLALAKVCQTAKSRRALLKRLNDIEDNQLCPTIPDNYRLPAKLIPEVSQFTAAEWASLKSSSFNLQHTALPSDVQRYATALEVLNQRQRINLRIFERKIREYNQLLNSSPTYMVAGIYGLKPIKLSTVR